MAENEQSLGAGAPGDQQQHEQQPQGGEGEQAQAPQPPAEEITYHAVEKDGHVTALWEMQGRKHLRTIDPRSRQGQDILRLYTAEHHDEAGAGATVDAATT